MKEIVIATKNQGKVREIAAALQSLRWKVFSLADFPGVPDAVEDGTTFEENALIKAQFYAEATGKPCLADDSGLEVDALDGAPGVYSARYAGEHAADEDNNRKLLEVLKEIGAECPAARFRCVLAYVDTPEAQPIVVEGRCGGQILASPRGDGGFGYDPLFFVDGWQKSMAELTLEEKNRVSHRGKALGVMAEKLAGIK